MVTIKNRILENYWKKILSIIKSINMNKIRIGIIGMGRMGITHASIINSHPEVELVSVSDTSTMILGYLKKLLPNIKTYTDYKDQLNAADLEGVIVCTPPRLHYDVCKLACEKGIAVFCEKPFTLDPVQAKNLSEMFDKAGIINQVGYVNRYSDIFMAAKKFINIGIIDDVVSYKAEMYSNAISKPQSGEGWRSKRENGGGVTYEIAAHLLNLIDYYLGAPEKVVGSSMQHVFSEEVEDIVSASLIHKKCSGIMMVDWSDTSYRKPMIKLEFFGAKGKIMVDSYAMKIFLNQENKEYKLMQGWNSINATDAYTPVPFYVRGNEFTRQLYDFVDSILNNTNRTTNPFISGYRTQKLIHDIFNDFENNNKMAR